MKIEMNNKRILITGAAGFIGAGLAKRILSETPSAFVVGIDNVNDYYDTGLKESRLAGLEQYERFTFVRGDIADQGLVEDVFRKYNPQIVVNLAAQAGVRYSIFNPQSYIQSNLIGFFNILESCRHSYDGGNEGVAHLVYASSSSVYGSNQKVPYSTQDRVDHPVSLYAATKKADELMAHAYASLYKIPSTGLRFFTVYGPEGRPDMAYFGFTDKMVRGETIQIYNYGDMKRDFTYIDDILTGVVKVLQKSPDPEQGVPYRLYNIGNNRPESLLDFVGILERCLLREGIIAEPAKKEFLPMQPGDVYQTYADVEPLIADFDFKPSTGLEEGLTKFSKWYKSYMEQKNLRDRGC